MDTRTANHSIEKELDLQFSQLRKESNQFQGFSIEALRLLVRIKQNKHLVKKKNHFNCQVIELEKKEDGSSNINQFLVAIKQIIPSDTPQRLQFIIKNGGHYTSLDVRISSAGNQCMVLDAIGDLRGQMLALQAVNLKDDEGRKFFTQVYLAFPDDNIHVLQTDSFSCPILAYDHAQQAAKIENLYEYLADYIPNNKKEQFIIVSWMQLPAKLVWNAQSVEFVQAYLDQHQEESDLFQPHRRFHKLLQEIDQPTLATELLFSKYKKHYMDLKTRKNYQAMLDELTEPTVLQFNDISLREKLILIVHAHHYWLNISKKKTLPKRIQKMQDASSLQEFISEAKSTSFTPTLFKVKTTQHFYKAIQMQDAHVIDEYYQQAKQNKFN
ncbi:MAG: hypothetical protein WAW86_05945 [Gammaproteobacteria bacterium]